MVGSITVFVMTEPKLMFPNVEFITRAPKMTATIVSKNLSSLQVNSVESEGLYTQCCPYVSRTRDQALA